MSHHREESCKVPFCRECLDNIKRVAQAADSMIPRARPESTTNNEDNLGPWNDCGLLRDECREKGTCIGHTQPSVDATNNEYELDRVLFDARDAIAFEAIGSNDPEVYRQIHDAAKSALQTLITRSVVAELEKLYEQQEHVVFGPGSSVEVVKASDIRARLVKLEQSLNRKEG